MGSFNYYTKNGSQISYMFLLLTHYDSLMNRILYHKLQRKKNVPNPIIRTYYILDSINIKI